MLQMMNSVVQMCPIAELRASERANGEGLEPGPERGVGRAGGDQRLQEHVQDAQEK